MSQPSYIYGLHAVLSSLKEQPERVKTVYLLKSRKDQRLTQVLECANQQGIGYQLLQTEAFNRLLAKHSLQQVRHQGVLMQVVAAPLLKEADLDCMLDSLQEAPLLLVLDGVTDPHNLGACLRTAEAAGVHGVIAPKDKSASLTSVAVKAASGAADTIPFYSITNLARTLSQLKDRGIWIYGAVGESDVSLYQSRFNQATALVMGAEGSGLRRLTRELCDELVSIPMQGKVSSLNVSVATGVCLFEIVRQRALA